MAVIYSYKCDSCDFEALPESIGRRIAIVDHEGKKKYSMEFSTISDIAKHVDVSDQVALHWYVGEFDKIPADVKALIENNVRQEFQFLCMDCRASVSLDPKKDELVCPQCHSSNLVSEMELDGKTCPSCSKGTMKRVMWGMS